MKILTTRSQLRYTLETAHRVIFEPGGMIGGSVPLLDEAEQPILDETNQVLTE
jgi:hypothetical protein